MFVVFPIAADVAAVAMPRSAGVRSSTDCAIVRQRTSVSSRRPFIFNGRMVCGVTDVFF